MSKILTVILLFISLCMACQMVNAQTPNGNQNQQQFDQYLQKLRQQTQPPKPLPTKVPTPPSTQSPTLRGQPFLKPQQPTTQTQQTPAQQKQQTTGTKPKTNPWLKQNPYGNTNKNPYPGTQYKTPAQSEKKQPQTPNIFSPDTNGTQPPRNIYE